MKQVDVRGLSCPQPVIMVRHAIAALGGGKLEVLLDSVTAKANVIRAAQREGCNTEVTERGDEFSVIISRK